MRNAIALVAITLLGQDATVIRVPVRLVAVPTMVYSRDGKLIPGLKKADFRVLDDGAPQAIDIDTDDAPVSVVIAIQANLEVRGPVRYINKVGSVMEAHLVGETGHAAVISYADSFRVLKPFGLGDVQAAFRAVSVKGSHARIIDAGMEAVTLLKERPRTHARVLLFIGQGTDHGSAKDWAALEEQADRENVSVYALKCSDIKADALSSLVAGTGGTELRFHQQAELEDAIGTLGVELRSAYLLSYRPSSDRPGRHAISVEVSVPGARTRARPGYVMSPN